MWEVPKDNLGVVPNYRALTGITPQQKIICVVIGWGYVHVKC